MPTKLRLSEALTERSRLLGRTSGPFKGIISDKLTDHPVRPGHGGNGHIYQNDPELGDVRRKLFNFTPMTFTVGADSPIGFESVEKFATDVKARFESITQLFSNSERLYEAILAANADKKITVNGREMTVAFAIVYRDVFLNRKKDQLKYLQWVYQDVLTKAEASDKAARLQVDRILEQEVQSDKKTDPDRIKRMQDDWLESRLAKVHDPLGLKQVIDDLEDEIARIESDIKTGLFNNNVSTEIEYEPSAK